jgi:hypothetical protein
MSEVRPLKEKATSPLARSLLDSVSLDRPDAGALGRALGAIGAGAAVVAATAAGQATAAAGGSVAPGAAKGGVLLLVKWAGLGVVGVALTASTVQLVRTQIASEPAAAVAPTSPSEAQPLAAPRPSELPPSLALNPAPAATQVLASPPSSSVASDLPTGSAAPATSRIEALTPERPVTLLSEPSAGSLSDPASPVPVALPEPAPPAPATPDAVQPAPPISGDSAGAQLAALQSVRAALSAGDPLRALRELDGFDASHRSSLLAEEATVLRIDALVDCGRVAQARTLGVALLQRAPHSAYAEHVRSKIGLH